MKAVLCLIFCLIASLASASEVQRHGLGFEHWVADTFFGGYRPSGPTDKWDIPAAANKNHGNIPVNPKATQYGEPMLLGDALRQYDIDEPFLLMAGFWEQDGRDKKFVQSVVTRIDCSAAFLTCGCSNTWRRERIAGRRRAPKFSAGRFRRLPVRRGGSWGRSYRDDLMMPRTMASARR